MKIKFINVKLKYLVTQNTIQEQYFLHLLPPCARLSAKLYEYYKTHNNILVVHKFILKYNIPK